MAIAWTKELETGNTLIDTEHKKLIAAINDLMAACSEGKGRVEVERTIDFLADYTKTHFSHEEALQRKSGYPDYVNHKKLHEAFVKDVTEIQTKLKNEGASIVLVSQVNTKVSGWLLNHIKKEDTKIAQHIISN